MLTGTGCLGEIERDAAILFFSVATNAQENFDFTVYKHDTVTSAVNLLFDYKCAYCETYYGSLHPVDVEHYRPKGAVILAAKLTKPGYYWLAATWNNLLPSCIDCNRERHHRHKDRTISKSGKGNHFPLADESRRARMPHREVDESPLLLDPCSCNPSQHLEFITRRILQPDGTSRTVSIVRPRDVAGHEDKLGRASIDIYGLNRPLLVDDRTRRAIEVLEQIDLLNDIISKSKAHPMVNFDDTIVREIQRLEKYARPEERFSAMARALIDEFRAKSGI